jgi:flavorubredoxin
MSNSFHRRTETFIVRLWAEYLEQIPPIWRGEIEHVDSGQTLRFGDRGQMLEFIQTLTIKLKQTEQEKGDQSRCDHLKQVEVEDD